MYVSAKIKVPIRPTRDAVVDQKLGAELRKAAKKVSDKGYRVNGKHYKRIPQGYNPDHQNAEFLLFNGLHAMVEEKVPKAFYSEALIDHAFSHYKNMLPLHQWLKKVTGN